MLDHATERRPRRRWPPLFVPVSSTRLAAARRALAPRPCPRRPARMTLCSTPATFCPTRWWPPSSRESARNCGRQRCLRWTRASCLVPPVGGRHGPTITTGGGRLRTWTPRTVRPSHHRGHVCLITRHHVCRPTFGRISPVTHARAVLGLHVARGAIGQARGAIEPAQGVIEPVHAAIELAQGVIEPARGVIEAIAAIEATEAIIAVDTLTGEAATTAATTTALLTAATGIVQ